MIGIIAVLIGLLLPALSKAREQANRTKCAANLRSLGQAMILYANDSRDWLPNLNPPNTSADYSATNTVLVALAKKYVRQAATFHCPSDSDPVPQDIVTADPLLSDSARVSYDFYSIYWRPEFGPKWVRVRMAPLAWDWSGGQANAGSASESRNTWRECRLRRWSRGMGARATWDGDNRPGLFNKYFER